MIMPEDVKEELRQLHECIKWEQERYQKAIKPYIDRIAFINNCYPSPMVVSKEILEKFIRPEESSEREK